MYQTGYLQRRRPEVEPERFRARWRDHYQVAAACTGFWAPVRRYVQDDVLPAPAAAFDAVGEFYYDSKAAWRAALDEPHDAIFADADTFFAVRPTEHFFGGEVRPVGGAESGDYKVMAFFARGAGVEYADFDRGVHAVAEVGARLGGGAAIAGAMNRHLSFEANVRVWLAGPGDIEALLAEPEWQSAYAAVGPLIDSERSLVLGVRENVMQAA